MMVGFVVVLLCANLIGPAKTCEIDLTWLPWFGGVLVFGAGNIFFPISYIFGDVLTEVYGYARARKVIWAGFGAMVFATIMAFVIINLPVAASEPFNEILQPALETVFGNTYRIVFGSILAFWAGDFVNAFIMAKMKLLTRGRYLWTRTIGSTMAGQAVDSMIFYPIAFYGIWESGTLFQVIIFNCVFKILVEVVMTPVTYAVVGILKHREQEDFFDNDTNFTPFSIKD
ncbi:MAG: putative queuosine precursor transporter [Gammaproteobacteria bacterium]|nr:putative queuosine precursor transporter [Gammaproteobacteria bacterium]